jgi:ribosome biogenesis GTPase / thiamine phosphate phosphatase
VMQRRAVEGKRVQIIAANVDVAFLVMAMTEDLNTRRLERYLVAAREAGVTPVVVLTKADLSPDADAAIARVSAIADGAAVLALSARTGYGMTAMAAWLSTGATCVLLGSSGAGKSTLLNALAGHEAMTTGAVREDDQRGRHTTTHRELFRLPGGALLIDTPGMREFGVVAEAAALGASFTDVTDMITACRFSNCQHKAEPGCAVRAALEDRSLDPARWAAWEKLQRELAWTERREDPAVMAATRQKWKKIHKTQRDMRDFEQES